MRTKTLATITVVAAAALCASGAKAGFGAGLYLQWELVDNTSNPLNGMSPATDPNSPFNPNDWFTLRLRLHTFGDPNVQVSSIFMGDAAFPHLSNEALYTNGTVYNHALGGNVRTTGLDDFFPAIAFDTHVAIGGLPPSDIFFPLPGAMNLGTPVFDSAIGLTGIRGFWATPLGGPHVPIGVDGITILQITVSADTTYLGGEFLAPDGSLLVSRIAIGTSVGAFDLQIPGAGGVPTPGAAAIFGVAGLALARRRR